MSESEANPGSPAAPQDFATTHWSVVLRASRDGTAQAAALEELCVHYWRPIYAFIRRRGNPPEEAQDLTQGFFERFLEKSWLADVDPGRARFRAFLLTMVTRFLATEFRRGQALKRGGGQFHFSVHDPALEDELSSTSSQFSPEEEFDRRWALTVLGRGMERLKAECLSEPKRTQFEKLSPFLSQEPAAGVYSTLATELKMSASALAVAVHRLRQRYRELVRLEISETLANPADTDTELKHLLDAMSRG